MKRDNRFVHETEINKIHLENYGEKIFNGREREKKKPRFLVIGAQKSKLLDLLINFDENKVEHDRIDWKIEDSYKNEIKG